MFPGKKINAFIELTKPSITFLVLVTTVLGFYCARGGVQPVSLLLWTLLGSALSCGGASALNQYLERDTDGLMKRTMHRPLPSGVLTPAEVLAFGTTAILAGVLVLFWQVNLLTAFLSLLTCFLYVLVYTPMKKLSWHNTTVGAIPGAIPPMGGWAAATNHIDFGAWMLFMIMFTWQHPHFYAIAWMLKEDYAKAGLKMLPVVYPDGKLTFAQIMAFTFLLVAFSITPWMIGMSGKLYYWGALLLGLVFLASAWRFRYDRSVAGARRVLAASVIYLPLLFLLIVVDGMIRGGI